MVVSVINLIGLFSSLNKSLYFTFVERGNCFADCEMVKNCLVQIWQFINIMALHSYVISFCLFMIDLPSVIYGWNVRVHSSHSSTRLVYLQYFFLSQSPLQKNSDSHPNSVFAIHLPLKQWLSNELEWVTHCIAAISQLNSSHLWFQIFLNFFNVNSVPLA